MEVGGDRTNPGNSLSFELIPRKCYYSLCHDSTTLQGFFTHELWHTLKTLHVASHLCGSLGVERRLNWFVHWVVGPVGSSVKACWEERSWTGWVMYNMGGTVCWRCGWYAAWQTNWLIRSESMVRMSRHSKRTCGGTSLCSPRVRVSSSSFRRVLVYHWQDSIRLAQIMQRDTVSIPSKMALFTSPSWISVVGGGCNDAASLSSCSNGERRVFFA